VCRWLAELETAGFIEIEPAANQYGQRKIFIVDSAVPKMAGQKWQAKNGAHNDPSKITVQEENTPLPPQGGTWARFDEFWQLYPNKVGKKECLDYWMRRKLDEETISILAGLLPWKICDSWKRGFVVDPIRFLKKELWKDTPPATLPEPPRRVEIAIREATADEIAEAEERQRVLAQIRMGRAHEAR
jgi:hypothetical protein